jgi:hypothetical protein
MLTIGWWNEPNRAKKVRQVEFVIFFTNSADGVEQEPCGRWIRWVDFRLNFGLASRYPAPIFYAARTPYVRMFIEAEKKKLTSLPNLQPPLPFATSGPLGNGAR